MLFSYNSCQFYCRGDSIIVLCRLFCYIVSQNPVMYDKIFNICYKKLLDFAYFYIK